MSHEQTIIEKFTLNHKKFSSNALCFIPPTNNLIPNCLALFTHGFTSSKVDLIAWATRLSDAGIITSIFDLPGHYLGSYNEVHSFDDFKNHAHELFHLCHEGTYSVLTSHHPLQSPQTNIKLILGGHSLGALLALKAHSLPSFQRYKNNMHYISVGLGINPDVKVHLFDSEFYQKTLNIRKQLVSPSLNPQHVFPWIKDHKHNIELQGNKITLLCGLDDIVVGKGGAKHLKELLEKHNEVELIEPSRLPHHEPQLAAGHIASIIKKILMP